jgi:hypothetical protein
MIVSAVSTVDDLLTVFSPGLDPDRLVVDLEWLALDPNRLDLVMLGLDIGSIE